MSNTVDDSTYSTCSYAQPVELDIIEVIFAPLVILPAVILPDVILS